MEHIIKTRPPYDKTHPNPNKNYGVGALMIWFYVKGQKGAVQFLLSTGSYLKSNVQNWVDKGRCAYDFNGEAKFGFLDGWDIGYHSPIPQYDGHKSMDDDCELTGGKCYYGGSALRAKEPLEVYLSEGEEGLWQYLESYYIEIFGEDDAPIADTTEAEGEN